MTVVLLGTTKRFIGTAADAKPTGVPAGSTFYAQDTGLTYVTYDNGANWVSTSDDAVGSSGGGSTPGALVNRSGTITTGGTAQTLAAANATRKYLLVQNPTAATESLWINFTTAAVASQPSVEVSAGQTFIWEGTFVPNELISVLAATTGHAFIAKEGG